MQRGDYTDRVVNPAISFEAGGILPQPSQGRRLYSVNNLRITKNQSIVGGAQITLAWINDTATVDQNTYYEINVFSGTNFQLISTEQNINSTDIAKVKPLQAPIKVKQSPAEITVYATVAQPVTLVVTIRHSSGILSLPSFSSAATAFIRPLETHIARAVGTITYTMSKTKDMLLLADPSAGTVTVNLPPISEVIDGFSQRIKHIGTSGNVVLTPVASGVIDGASTYTINISMATVQYEAERSTNKWWITYFARNF